MDSKLSAEYNTRILQAVGKIIQTLEDEFCKDPEVDPILSLTTLITSFVDVGETYGFTTQYLREAVNGTLDNLDGIASKEEIEAAVMRPAGPRKNSLMN